MAIDKCFCGHLAECHRPGIGCEHCECVRFHKR